MTTYHKDGTLPPEGFIFVFGSNLAGIHGAGAARAALDHFGAELGVGEGVTGQAYAIPTKATLGRVRTLAEVEASIWAFIRFARLHPSWQFFVTRIGCGLAGFDDGDIAPVFAYAPDNCSFPTEWRPWLG